MAKQSPTAATAGGGRLLQLRLQAGKAQLQIEAEAGLGCGYLQRIEAGKVRQPQRATLERLLAALEVRYNERREVLALFGYQAAAPLPDAAEIAWARAVARPELEAVAFPAYLLDCGVRLLAWNRLLPALFPVVGHEGRRIAAEHWSMLRLWLDPRFGMAERVGDAAANVRRLIHTFRHELERFGDEPWCAGLVAELYRDLPQFRAAWDAPAPVATASAARAMAPLRLLLPERVLHFWIAAEPLTRDARFRIVSLLPADAQTMEQCARWAAQGPG